jgi:ribosomal protein S18 acetylase RimI-like enzyme
VALDERDVVGFAQLLSDGEIQAFLSLVAVDSRFRGRGIGRALVTEALRMSGGERVDLLSEDDAAGFYQAFPHFRKPGFRLYPFHETDTESVRVTCSTSGDPGSDIPSQGGAEIGPRGSS